RKLVISSASFSGADCRLILNTFLPVPAFGLAFFRHTYGSRRSVVLDNYRRVLIARERKQN
ncbi:hypothetical protein ACRXXS_004924, partial [Escherichia coli]